MSIQTGNPSSLRSSPAPARPHPIAPGSGRSEFDAATFLKARAATDDRDVYVEWTGSIYAMLPDQTQCHLFDIVGMNVARGVNNGDGSWSLVSRELTYYLDPDTGAVLHSWDNPWTGETVPVVHVANDPVQSRLTGTFGATLAGDAVIFTCDVFPAYPNPLGNDPRFQDYSPSPHYSAAEFFKLTVPLSELTNPELAAVETMTVAWHRIGPWLPWMKMGDRSGQLVYSACGQRVAGFEALPPLLQTEIRDRLPKYRHAPDHHSTQKNMTSWRYFKEHFEAYLRGEMFPLPELAV
ncbi:MAG: DUF1838 domain-containing protein [Limnothrix sp.]|uniref:DUF1838 domain-containing protein n=1 Tax=Limnothrix redekei LRLZ20PSL1 TaxID=3112953 RepID=A0ABW7C715_9CYAN|nr:MULTISPECIES: DUF1838 domain-containing protein [unclassified Limnothrix]MEB3119539.1 DUF1838 domain-containing protein [Limnothrix sp.]MBD2159372.1 DUF1838 domain-containing protein [Limnothrix sp. FACHB-1083]MBD2193131.1 DUF1838 domain-containing protein [Limnothrix sp. FACHB-1088]MBD2552698.1 DUF1838 domain-containing protein [Limnothrix sp. FACHB-708]MBD2589968.1 DUF1838 domain-containing protein [Limnothrix sp. FACHB-406]